MYGAWWSHLVVIFVLLDSFVSYFNFERAKLLEPSKCGRVYHVQKVPRCKWQEKTSNGLCESYPWAGKVKKKFFFSKFFVKFQVRKSRQIAEAEGIKVPTKVEDYVVRAPRLSSSLHQSFGSSVDVEENDNNLVSVRSRKELLYNSIVLWTGL